MAENDNAAARREQWIVSAQCSPEQRGYVYVLAAIKQITVGMNLDDMGASVNTAVFWGFDFDGEARLALSGDDGRVSAAAAQSIARIGGGVMIEINDITNELPKHATKRYRQRPLSNVDTIVIHHTATRPSISAEAIARYHVSANGRNWPGIAYHFVIPPDGRVLQTNALETMSYHVGTHNDHTIGVCLVGNFTYAPPTDEQIESGARLVAYLRDVIGWLAAVRPHRALSQTACPGATWDEWLSLLETEPDDDEPPDDGVDWQARFDGLMEEMTAVVEKWRVVTE